MSAFKIVLVLALSIGANAIVDKQIQLDMAEITPFYANMKEMLPFTAVGGAKKSSSCCECVKDSAEWIVKRAVVDWKKECETTQCPFIKKHCEASRKYPKVAVGMLIELSRPVRTGLAYCIGKESCDQDGWTEEKYDMLKTEISDSINNEATDAAEKELGTLEFNPDDLDASSNQVEKLRREVTDLQFKELMDGDLAFDDSMDFCGTRRRRNELHAQLTCNKCTMCVEMTSYKVMKMVSSKLEEWCEKTSNDNFLRFCKIADKYPQQAFGFLLGKVEPWKYAYGYCRAEDACGQQDRPEMGRNAIREEEAERLRTISNEIQFE